jgi:hypothetical protein
LPAKPTLATEAQRSHGAEPSLSRSQPNFRSHPNRTEETPKHPVTLGIRASTVWLPPITRIPATTAKPSVIQTAAKDDATASAKAKATAPAASTDTRRLFRLA